MISKPQATTPAKYYLTFLVVVISSICWQCCCAYRVSDHRNPNMNCPPKNEQNVWHSCKHGGYIVNPDPKTCGDRYVCYVGIDEACYRGDKCANNAICTMCGVCQKCDSAENCSDFDLCPNPYGFATMDFIKRSMGKAATKTIIE